MTTAETLIHVVYDLEIKCLAFQGVVEILFGNIGINFFLPFFLQFAAFCLSIIRYFLILVHLYVESYVADFGFIIPTIAWIWAWKKYIKTLYYVTWLQNQKLKFLNSVLVKYIWPQIRKFSGQYISYFKAYHNIVRSYINVNYGSLGNIQKTKPEDRRKILSKEWVDWLQEKTLLDPTPVNLDKLFPFSSIVKFIHTFFIYMAHTFKFGNRKQTYFRNYFNAKRRYNNWIWKWRK